MSELSDQLRVRVLEVLALTADGEAQCNYQAQAPHVDVAAELFNQWDEVYFPTSQEFRSAFSDEQLAALARYSRIIEEISTCFDPSGLAANQPGKSASTQCAISP